MRNEVTSNNELKLTKPASARMGASFAAYIGVRLTFSPIMRSRGTTRVHTCD